MLIEKRELFFIKINGLMGLKLKCSLWFLEYMYGI